MSHFSWAVRMLCLCVALFATIVCAPAHAQSLLRDAETEAFLKEVCRPIFIAAGLDPRNVEFALVNDESINAFVATGQTIYINSGLILEATDINQVIGVIAHETGHITGGHSVRSGDAYTQASRISILSLLLAAGAIAAGAGDAGAAILGGGQQAALGSILSYSRAQESSADQAAATFLNEAHISGRGFIQFFELLQQQEISRAIPQTDYFRSHPTSGDRIARLTERLQQSSSWSKPSDPDEQRRFLLIKAKLAGFTYPPARTFQLYPEADDSAPAHYARTYAYHKAAFTDRAAAEVDRLLASDPDYPYFLELKGQVLLESGRVEEAIPPLRSAYKGASDQPLIAGLLGHALLAREDKADVPEALRILRDAVSRDPQNPFAWYQLGVAYDRSGDEPRALLASAEQQSLSGDIGSAARSATQAARALPRGSPDWLRAQDILVVVNQQLEQQRRRR